MLFSCCPRLLRRIGVIGATVCLALGLVACGGDGGSDTAASDPEPASVSVPDTASLWSVLQTDDRFTTLATAIDSARLDSQLTAGGPYTLFAPTNTAFEQLPEGTVDALLTDQQDRLRTILLYHVVDGRRRSTSVSSADTIATLAGSGLPVRRTDTTVVVGANVPVLAADIETANGLIHVIDGVLRPPEE